MSALGIVLALVVAQRLAELIYAQRNARALLHEGGVEFGARHYPAIVALHAAWLCALAVLVPWHTPPNWDWLALFILLQAARLWIIASLGRRWTTRIIVLPSRPLIHGGPYRWLRHPNYLVVAGEIAVLPLAFGAWRLALVFSVVNAAVTAWRIAVEDRALAPQRRGHVTATS